MKIKIDDLTSSQVIALLEEHLRDMHATSPPESNYALDVEKLKSDDITFFSGWIDNHLAGCIAIRQLNENDAELKSMRTAKAFKGQGVASKLLEYVIAHATEKGFSTLYLETGTQSYFDAARNLYRKYGFVDCGPFSNYKLDPNSHFMAKLLKPT